MAELVEAVPLALPPASPPPEDAKSIDLLVPIGKISESILERVQERLEFKSVVVNTHKCLIAVRFMACLWHSTARLH